MENEDLYNYIRNRVPDLQATVNLLSLARNRTLVLDSDNCLHKLYGGFFINWANGGQWNQMLNFLFRLKKSLNYNKIHLVVFINGTLETGRENQWMYQQERSLENVTKILGHLDKKEQHPPKAWWVAPAGIKCCLKLALRELGLTTVCTVYDHKQELMRYCRDHNVYGIIANDPEYLAFNPPRYFSLEHMKFISQPDCHVLKTQEYVLKSVAADLDIPMRHLPLVALLLGTHFVTEDELVDFHQRLCHTHQNQIPKSTIVNRVADFIRHLGPSADDINELIARVFIDTKSDEAEKLRIAIHYYYNLTPLPESTKDSESDEIHCQMKVVNKISDTKVATDKVSCKVTEVKETQTETMSTETQTETMSTIEGQESSKYIQKVVDQTKTQTNSTTQTETMEEDETGNRREDQIPASDDVSVFPHDIPRTEDEQSCSCKNTVVEQNETQPNVTIDTETMEADESTKEGDEHILIPGVVSAKVHQVAFQQHRDGHISPYIYHILSKKEITLPALLEDREYKEFPSIHRFYRPVRQAAYGILFNLRDVDPNNDEEHENVYEPSPQQRTRRSQHESVKPISICEWLWSPNEFVGEMVEAEIIYNLNVPSVERFWFGTSNEKHWRLKSFLNCMRSNTPLMYDITYVPRHLLLFASVVRYIMTEPEILRKYEFDALLTHAVSLPLIDLEAETRENNSLKLSSRVAQLATLFMVGVENALLANDACGVPIPWQMCCPWRYFNGHFLQSTLLKAKQCRTVIQLCDNDNLRVVRVDNLRAAILEGLYSRYAHEPLGFRPSGRLISRPGDAPSGYRRNRTAGPPADLHASLISPVYGGISYNERCRLGRGGSYFDSMQNTRSRPGRYPMPSRRRGHSSTHDNSIPRQQHKTLSPIQGTRRRGSSEHSWVQESVTHSFMDDSYVRWQEHTQMEVDYDDDVPLPGRSMSLRLSVVEESNPLPGIGRGVRVGHSSGHNSATVSGSGRGTLRDQYGRGRSKPCRPSARAVGGRKTGPPRNLIEEYERASYELDVAFKDYIEEYDED